MNSGFGKQLRLFESGPVRCNRKQSNAYFERRRPQSGEKAAIQKGQGQPRWSWESLANRQGNSCSGRCLCLPRSKSPQTGVSTIVDHPHHAACSSRGISYSQFIYGLSKAEVELDRKSLSEIAICDPAGFDAIVETAKQALAA